jgi:hypothetical protein
MSKREGMAGEVVAQEVEKNKREREKPERLGVVIHACNVSYSEDGGRKTEIQRQSEQKA